jgi:PAN domain/Trypsin
MLTTRIPGLHRAGSVAISLAAVTCLASCTADVGEVAEADPLPTHEEEQVATVESPLLWADVTTERPEVARLSMGCGATLIMSNWFISAAHCFDYTNTVPPNSVLRVKGIAYTITELFNLDAVGGANDIVIGRLEEPVPGDIVPAVISGLPPANGDLVVIFGFGCTDRANPTGSTDGKKRFAEYNWNPSSRLCEGDSGGLVRRGRLNDGGDIVAINSAYRSDIGLDVFALPTPLSEYILMIIRARTLGFEPNMDRTGMDYRSQVPPGSGGILGCRSLCEQDARCRSFSYVQGTNTCFLKDGAPTPRPLTGVFSGLPLTRNAFDRWGGDYRSFASPSVEDCEANCARDTNCFAYTHANGTCWLKNTAGTVDLSCTTCRSGVRRGEVGMDRPGADYASFQANSQIDCARRCATESRCRAFTYVNAEAASNRRCFLKGTVPSPRPGNLFSISSGVRRGYDIGRDRPGNDIDNFTIASKPDPAICQAACEARSDCQSWTYVPPVPDLTPDMNGKIGMKPPAALARCWLKNAVPAAVSANGLVSGIRGMTFF